MQSWGGFCKNFQRWYYQLLSFGKWGMKWPSPNKFYWECLFCTMYKGNKSTMWPIKLLLRRVSLAYNLKPLYTLHCLFHRALVFPMFMRQGTSIPFLTFLCAFGFCSFNGSFQSHCIIYLGLYKSNEVISPRFIIGKNIQRIYTGLTCDIEKTIPSTLSPSHTT